MIKKFLFLILTLAAFSFAQSALAQSVWEEGFQGPGGCTTKRECREYCNEDSHKEECLAFAVENGLMTREEADRALKYLNQTGPGGCRGDECREYCSDEAHMDECIRFAEENGFINRGDGERFRKMRALAARGGPGGCKNEECQAYCEDESHQDECFAFAKENGLIGEDEARQFEAGMSIRKKIKEDGGPGGCKSEDECRDYCSDIEHVEECVEFGAAHTGQSQEEVRRMLEEFRRHKERFQNARPSGEFESREFRYSGDQEDSFEQGEDYRDNERMRREEQERRMREQMMREGYRPPEGYQMPQGYPDSNTYQGPDNYQQYQQNYQPYQYQYQGQPPPEYQPSSYDHSRSFISNVLSAFMAPFRN